MSTNFYLRETSRDVGTGKRVTSDIYIGKRSGGWTFMFNGMDQQTVQGWREFIDWAVKDGQQVVDEYDTPYTIEQFWEVVRLTTLPWGPRNIEPRTMRGDNAPFAHPGTDRRTWIDEGFSFSNYEFC